MDKTLIEPRQVVIDWMSEHGISLTVGQMNDMAKRILALAPSDAAGTPQPTHYFVYDPEDGYNEFKTDAERSKAHQEAIDGYLDDGWSEEVTSVVSGIVTHKTVKTDEERRPPPCAAHPDHDDEDCEACATYNEYPDHNYDTCCRYVHEQIAAPVAPAAVAPRQEEAAPVNQRALEQSMAEIEALSDTEDRGIHVSEAESIMLVLMELRRLRAGGSPAPWVWLRRAVKHIPTREEFLGAQRTRYVQVDEVLACIEEGEKSGDALCAAPTPTVAADAAQDAQPFALRFPTTMRKMWSGSEVQAWLDGLPPLYEVPTHAGDGNNGDTSPIEGASPAEPVQSTPTTAPHSWKLVPIERSYDMRAKALIAFNTAEQAGKDRDDALDAAWRAMLDVTQEAAAQQLVVDAGDSRGAARAPAWQTAIESPKRAIVFRVDVQADTTKDLASALFNLSNRVAADDLSAHSVSGGYNSGYEHWLTIADHPTHDEYVNQLNEYLAARKGASNAN
ncbi:hypothetical protein ACLKMY_00730 [Paraburkholderia mimosarum]|uniref:hypothetical protein n=1 Tax=Paraburkholderia mimosarum TaxID=312026 RepID=UPI0039C42C45